MSYILEALKRSQQERELGQTPTLISSPHLHAKSSGAPKIWIAVTSLLALSAVLLALYVLLKQESGRQQTTAPMVSQVAPALVSPSPSVAPPPTQTPHIKQVASTPNAPANRPAKVANASPPEPQATPSPAAEHSPHSELLADITRFKQRVMQDNTQSPAPTKSSTPKPTLRQPTKAEQDGQVGLPSFRELPAALQKQIPDHAVSVHVYSKHPAQRFVIMQSTRMQEGDSTEEGLILEQIRPNGMVLKFEQQRFFKER